MSELVLPAPLEHQVPVLEHGARFKLWRAGRRTGKSRAEFIAGVAGHGPNRKRRGVLQGGNVVWIAPDYKQAQAIWREEIRPRFAGTPFADVSEVEKRVTVRGLGFLQLLSAENIDAARGWKLDGICGDEAAYWDLEYGWTAVLRPALADREGWALFGSTTNAGHDGNSAKRVPSYFNLLCERVARGEMGSDWAVFHNRTDDNPKIPRAEIAALRAEYPAGSPTAAQELDAELNVAGGRYYDTLNADVHLVPREDLPKDLPGHWHYWIGYDWGYAHWAVACLFCMTPEGAVFCLESMWVRRAQDDEQASGVAGLVEDAGCPLPPSEVVIYAGRDCWSSVTARGGSGVRTFDIFSQRGLPMLEADTDRVNTGRAVRRLFAKADENRRQGLYLVDTPNNRRVWRQLCDAIPDVNDINKPAKVDADVDGRGGDDGENAFRYGVATRILQPAEPVHAQRGEDVNVGYDPRTGKPVDPMWQRFEREQTLRQGTARPRLNPYARNR